MDVNLRSRRKIKAGEIPVGECFKEIQKARCLQVIDLTQVDMFRELQAEGQKLVLRDDVVYCVDMETGIVDIIPKNQEVHLVNLRAKEVDE